MANSYKQQKRQRSIISLIVILVSVYLLSVTSFDAFVATPMKNKRIEFVTTKFGELKVYLEAKLPEIDSALVEHALQIDEQNKQLEDLNNLTAILKEDNKK